MGSAQGCRLRKRYLRHAGDINQVPADLLKTISIGFIADGLIFKGLIGPFRLVTGYSAIASEE